MSIVQVAQRLVCGIQLLNDESQMRLLSISNMMNISFINTEKVNISPNDLLKLRNNPIPASRIALSIEGGLVLRKNNPILDVQ